MNLIAPRSKPDMLLLAEDFTRFFEQAHLSVFRYIMVLCAGNQPEAEDIMAEAFLRAWEKRQQFSGDYQAALGWVITIARNLLIDRRRAETTHPEEEILDETLPDGEDSIETILVDGEQVQQVLNAIRRLPSAQQNMFVLRYLLGWRVRGIAGHLGIPENTITVSLRRAIAKLKKELMDKEIPSGRND